MKFDSGNFLCFLIFVMLMGGMVFAILGSIQIGGESIQEVNCYDRYSNEIQGLKCTAQVFTIPEKSIWILWILGFLMEIIVLLFGYLSFPFLREVE